jgi:hypothetical protein
LKDAYVFLMHRTEKLRRNINIFWWVKSKSSQLFCFICILHVETCICQQHGTLTAVQINISIVMVAHTKGKETLVAMNYRAMNPWDIGELRARTDKVAE